MRLNRLKTTYQRNLLLGQAVSLLIAVIAILLMFAFQESYVTIDLHDIKLLESFPLTGDNAPQNSGSSTHIRSRSGVLIDAVAGNGYNIDNYHHDSHGLDYSAIDKDDFIIPGGYYGNSGGDLYLALESGDTSDAWPIPNKHTFLQEYSIESFLSDRYVNAPGENHPLMINFVKPQYPGGLHYACDAIVKLGFSVTEKGFIRKIDIIDEDPAGFGFALAVKEALRNSWLWPAVRNGHKTGGYYILTYEFCEKCPATPVVVESEGDIVVTVK